MGNLFSKFTQTLKGYKNVLFIIAAALLVELFSAAQYYFAHNLLEKELDNRAESELRMKAILIRGILNVMEKTVGEHIWDIKRNIAQPDSMFNVATRIIQNTPKAEGSCLVFTPGFYPSKDRLFEPYAYKTGNGIQVKDLCGDDSGHDYTRHPAYKKMEKDRSYLVYIYIDDMTKRIVASAKLDKFVEVSCDKYNIGDSVKVIVWKQTELGYKVIVDNTYAGLLYKNEIFQQLHIGEQLDAVIKSVRPDGRLDVALQRDGKFHVDESSEKILAALREAGGFLPYGDKTSPEEIYRQFGISKKTFKKSVGALYKKQLLSIEEKGIKLL